MTLKIGNKIKSLRKQQNITQEKLADYLNISYQAVSKWENGLALPDISLIPALSNFFGVTSDILLGIKADENEEKISEYYKQAMDCSHTGEIEKGIEIVKEALDTYPNNSKLLSLLIGFLFGLFCVNGQKDLLKEIVVKAELVLQDSTNEEERIDVLEKLAYSYNLLEMQDKRKEKQQECVFANFEVMINHILWLGRISLGRKEFSKAVDIYSRAITLIESIGNEGFFLLKSAGAHNGLAMAYSSIGAVDKAYENIDKVIESYVGFEEILKKGKHSYETPILDMLVFSRNNLHANSTITEFEDWYAKMGHDYKNYFEAVINDKRFPALRERVEKTLADIKNDKL